MELEKFVHDPDAKLQYGFNWKDPKVPGGPWLNSDDSLDSADWNTDPDLILEDEVFDETRALVTVSVQPGVQPGKVYIVTNHIETEAGWKDNRSFEIQVKGR